MSIKNLCYKRLDIRLLSSILWPPQFRWWDVYFRIPLPYTWK